MSQSNDKRESFGERIKRLRQEAGYEVAADFAKLLDISGASLSQYENNTHNPPYEVVVGIAKYTKRSLDYIITGTEFLGVPVIDPESYVLVAQLKELPASSREYVLQAARLALETRDKVPTSFISPPTPETWAEFHRLLLNLAESGKKSKP